MYRRLHILSILFSCIIAFALLIGCPLRGHADAVQGTITILSGDLSETTTIPSAQTVTLNRNNSQSLQFPLSVSVANTSVFDGWSLNITTTQFSAENNPTMTLPTNASQITNVTVQCETNSQCTFPDNNVLYPIQVPAGTSEPTPMKFFNAASNTGIGGMVISPVVTVTIPANTKPGVYSSTINISIEATP